MNLWRTACEGLASAHLGHNSGEQAEQREASKDHLHGLVSTPTLVVSEAFRFPVNTFAVASGRNLWNYAQLTH
jgi:hypothetical protein